MKRITPIVPVDEKEAGNLTNYYFKVDWVKKKFTSHGNIFFIICYALELGMTPAQGLLAISMVKDKPVIGTDGLVALAYGSGKLEYFKETFETKEPEDKTSSDIPSDLTAVIVIKRKDIENEIKYTFSVEDAKRAGLWRAKPPSPWATYPKRMLQIRARGFAIRDAFGDELKGLISTEEVNDYPNLNPTKSVNEAPPQLEHQQTDKSANLLTAPNTKKQRKKSISVYEPFDCKPLKKHYDYFLSKKKSISNESFDGPPAELVSDILGPVFNKINDDYVLDRTDNNNTVHLPDGTIYTNSELHLVLSFEGDVKEIKDYHLGKLYELAKFEKINHFKTTVGTSKSQKIGDPLCVRQYDGDERKNHG